MTTNKPRQQQKENPPSDDQPPSTSMSTTRHLLNTFPQYIALYSTPPTPINTAPVPSSTRLSIIKWFATLSPPTRLSHLTVLSPPFTHVLLQMLSHPPSHVTFLLLPDLPSRDPLSLPSLCHRSSPGLLSRSHLANPAPLSLRSLTRLFSSGTSRHAFDTVSFREELVGNVEYFVGIMDGVSGGGFLNGGEEEWGEVGREWGEMGWLRGRGYYSLEEFVVNRIEIAVRAAWVSCCGNSGGRRRGVKERVKVRRESGVGANVFWRMRGCVEWWERLGVEVRRRVLRTVFGKAARAMVWCCFCC